MNILDLFYCINLVFSCYVFITILSFRTKGVNAAIINRLILCEVLIVILNLLSIAVKFYIGGVTVEKIKPYQINSIIWILVIAATIRKRKDASD